jgi:hypothetical protein
MKDGGVSGFNEHRKQGPFTYANDQPRAPSEEEIGIPVAEAIGGKRPLRRDLGVESLEEFASTANGQHLRSDFLAIRLGVDHAGNLASQLKILPVKIGSSITCI